APVREHTNVTSLMRVGDSWRGETEHGGVDAAAGVIAAGPVQRGRLPGGAGGPPQPDGQVHSAGSPRPAPPPPGGVLVVGSGASGAQIAEELVGSGRRTFLCVSRHRRVPRRLLGRDIMSWLLELGIMDGTRAGWVDGRMPPTVLVTGVDGGHD